MTVMVESPEDVLLSILSVLEASKSRSGQTHISPSMVGGCRAKAWLTVHQAPATNPTKVLAAHMGSAIHDWLANGARLLDPMQERFLIEHPVSRAYPDRIGVGGTLRGTLDLYDKDARRVDRKSVV